MMQHLNTCQHEFQYARRPNQIRTALEFVFSI
jgi:hypothetical protein